MKSLKFTIFCMLLCGCLVVASCSSDPQKQGPRETADAFLTAMQFGDYDKAKTFCSEGTAKNLDFMQTLSGLGANPMKDPFTITDTQEDGDYAKVIYDQGEYKDKVVNLRKDDGKWVVLISKTDNAGKKLTDAPDALADNDDEPDHYPEGKEMGQDKYRSFREGKSAKETAEEFVKALNYKDYGAAMRYGSESTNDMLEMQKSMSGLSDDKKNDAEKTVVRVEEDGNYAKAFYTEKGKKGEKVLKMGKDDHGNWQVIMSKSDMEDED